MKWILYILLITNLYCNDLEIINEIRIKIITNETYVENEIEEKLEKGTFDYYYLKGLFYNLNRKYDLSIKNLEKAYEIEKQNKVKLLLLDNYLQKRAYKEALLLINANSEFLDNEEILNLKNDIEDLLDKSLYSNLSLHTIYNDNYLEEYNKKSSFGNEIDFNLGKVWFIDEKKSFSTFFYSKNEIYYDSSEADSNYLDLMGVYKKENKFFNYLLPLELQYKIENKEQSDFDLSIGLQVEKYINLANKLTYTLGYKYKKDYEINDKGNSYFNTFEYVRRDKMDFRFKMNYIIEDLEINQLEKYIPRFTLSKKVGKSTFTVNYEIEYEKYKSSKRENLTNYLELSHLYKLNEKNWFIKSLYEYETLDSNYDSSDYRKNFFSLGIVKEL